MKHDDRNLDNLLDQALDAIRGSELDEPGVKAAADRVWQRLGPELAATHETEPHSREIRDCADFQALIPAYLRDGLNDAKALLLEDHVGECVPCRRALKQARAKQPGTRSIRRAPAGRSWVATLGWRAAAAALFFVTVWGLSVRTDMFSIEAGGLVHLERVEGDVFKVGEKGPVPVHTGDEVTFEDAAGLRTGRGANALVRLDDNSLVEMNERSELAVKQRRSLWRPLRPDSVVELDRGSVIVEAAERESGKLYLDTDDCSVASKGTIFAVNRGTRGSRVSAIEGEVQVASQRHDTLLRPGEQATTSPGLQRVPVKDEIAWSRKVQQHLLTLGRLSQVAEEIDRSLAGPELRYSTDLLDLTPRDTLIYVGIPNISGNLEQAYEMLKQRIAKDDLLNQWWHESVASSGADQDVERVMHKIRSYGEQLGSEIVVALPSDGKSEVGGPLVLAHLTRPAEFPELLRADLETLREQGQAPRIRILDAELPREFASEPGTPRTDSFVWIHGDLLAVSPEFGRIRELADRLAGAKASMGPETAFHRRLREAYEQGVEWVFALDIESLIDADPQSAQNEILQRMGLLDLQHLIAEHEANGDGYESRVELVFDQPRSGLAAWLAEPAPIGAMDFISPDATIAAAFVIKEPVQVVDELFGFIRADDAEFDRRLAEFQSEYGIDIRNDFAAALGGEFALALDGPVLPNPSWKLVLEVYDPARLQTSLQWAADQLNDLAHEAGHKGFRIEETVLAGQTYYQFKSLDTGLSANYTFVDGYMLAGASRALLERTLKSRRAGITLANSPQFLSQFPQDGQVNFSGMVYQNLGALLGSVASGLSNLAGQLDPEQRELVQQVGAHMKPSLALAYGRKDSIQFIKTTEGGLLTSSLGSFLRLDSLLSVQELVGRAVGDGTRNGSDPASDDADVRTEDALTKG